MMKILQIVLFAILSAAILFFGAKIMFGSSDSLRQNSDSVSSDISQTSQESVVDSIQQDSADVDDQNHDKTKTKLPEIEKETQDNKYDTLDAKSVAWGPGKNVDEQNKSTACLALQEQYKDLGSIFIMDTDKVYLSFDLGYEAGYTNDILDTLKDNNVKAMFFLTGTYAAQNEEIITRIITEGHTIGNHGAKHKNMTTLTYEQSTSEIMDMHKIMQEKYDYSPYLFRFPEGAFNEKSMYVALQNGYHSVFWSFAYNDWDNNLQPEYDSALEKTVGALHQGAVYLLHPMKTNSEILDEFIKTAKEKDYIFGVL